MEPRVGVRTNEADHRRRVCVICFLSFGSFLVASSCCCCCCCDLNGLKSLIMMRAADFFGAWPGIVCYLLPALSIEASRKRRRRWLLFSESCRCCCLGWHHLCVVSVRPLTDDCWPFVSLNGSQIESTGGFSSIRFGSQGGGGSSSVAAKARSEQIGLIDTAGRHFMGLNMR